ncbi:hypothetical protein BDW71DRAFT_176188 [Aspergillus fruticulosus]
MSSPPSLLSQSADLDLIRLNRALDPLLLSFTLTATPPRCSAWQAAQRKKQNKSYLAC